MPSYGILLLFLTLTSPLSNTLVGSSRTASTAGDVTSFGAMPNDGKDDTAAIQRALDACAKNGGRAFVPAGTYTISLPAYPKVIDTCLAVPSNCTLLGEGEASILKWDTAVNSENWWRMIGVDLDPGAKGDASVDNVTIRDLAIDGSTTHTVYPCFNATTGAELCEHNAGMFFYVHPPHVIRDVTVQRVLVEAVAGDCMAFADGVQGLLVEDVVVRDFLRQGVDLAGDALSRDFIVRNVTERPWQVVKQPGGSTIHIEEAGGLGNVLIENSVVNHSILAGGVNNLTIRGNLVHGTLLGNGNTNLTVINNTVVALEGIPVLLSQGFTRTANISFNTLVAETVPGGRNLPYNTDTSHLYPTGISIWGAIHDPYAGMEKFTFYPTSTNLTIHGNVFVGNLSGPNWNHHPQFHISAQAMTSFRAISLNGVDGAVVSGNAFEQGGNASENVCECCTVVEADPATRCANVSILKTDDLDDATRSAAAAATKPRVPFSVGSAPVSFFMDAASPSPQWCSLLEGQPRGNCTARWTNLSETYPVGRDTMTLNSVFLDGVSGAELTLQGLQYTNASIGVDGAVEWSGRLRNAGNASLAKIGGPLNWGGQYASNQGPPLLLDWTLPLSAAQSVTVQRQRGSNMTREDFSMVTDVLALPNSSTGQFFPRGRSSDGWLPIFNLHLGSEGGVVFALGWTGNWVASVSRSSDGASVRVQVGLGSLCAVLQPGEAYSIGRVLAIPYVGLDPRLGYTMLRRLMWHYKIPRNLDGSAAGRYIASESQAPWKQPRTEASTYWEVNASKNAGLNAYWMDANWFKGEFPRGAGNWRLPLSAVESDEYPHGVAAVSDLVHAAPNPLAMIMWCEPERVAAGSYIAENYPEYMLPDGTSGAGLLNLGNPDARRYITEFLCAMVSKFQLQVLRFDFNIDPAWYWFVDADHVNKDRRGVAEAAYIEGLYHMWDEIRSRNPGLILDNCASGGRRLDMETMARSVSLWRTDWTSCDVLKPDPCLDFSSLQAQTMGATQWLPINSGGTGSNVSPYAWRSAGVASKALVWGEAGWAKFSTPAAMAQLRLAVAESERLAALLLAGADFWNLSPVDPDDQIWAAYQLHSPAMDCGFVLAFRRVKAVAPERSFALVGLRPTSQYSLSWSYNFTVAQNTTAVGATLLDGAGKGGLVVELPSAGSSVLVEYCAAAAAAHRG